MAVVDDLIKKFEDMDDLPPKVVVVMEEFKKLSYVIRDSIKLPRNVVALQRVYSARRIVLKEMLAHAENHGTS